ncbi:MAG: hypothetical protein NVS3B26_17450 [Mycobacteriales bacterium]
MKLRAGDLHSDPASRRCWLRELDIWLSPREFALAEYVVRRKGQVVTRSQINDNVWDGDIGVDSHIVEIYIG